MEPEVKWLPLVGYEDRYHISEYGKIKRLYREFNRKREGFKNEVVPIPEKILTAHPSRQGYMRITLRKDSPKRSRLRIHRLVAETFIGKAPKDKPHVNHKNGIKDDNHYSNLEWCSILENNHHAIAKGLIPDPPKGKEHYGARAVNQLNLKTRKVIKQFDCIMDAERELGIHNTGICKVCKGKAKSAGGYLWEYA